MLLMFLWNNDIYNDDNKNNAYMIGRVPENCYARIVFFFFFFLFFIHLNYRLKDVYSKFF